LAESSQGIEGLLPLSWIKEAAAYGYFPGETWEGKTWLEQNRIICNGNGVKEALLSRLNAPANLRYLLPYHGDEENKPPIDEVGYLFLPSRYDYSFENYIAEFSGKSAKRLRRELESFQSRDLKFRYNHLEDFDYMIRFNLERYGSSSYFYDVRFRESFRSLMYLLNSRGWLRLTTVFLEGEVAAVDLGSVFKGVYTLLAGGTNAHFPGVAKLINTHHMRFACERQLKQADFLCGSFSWKELFHLTPRPLYLCKTALAAAQVLQRLGVERVA
jgi:hypothetical protein